MDESSPAQNRRSRRANVLMSATLELSGEAIVVKLRNLSAEGALIEGDRLPVEGAQLLFRKGDLVVAGSIAWSEGKQAGVSFAQALGASQMLRHVPAPRPRVSPKFHRPGLTSRELSHDERDFAQRLLLARTLPPARD